MDRWSTFWKRIVTAYDEAKKAELEKAIGKVHRRLTSADKLCDMEQFPEDVDEDNVMDVQDKSSILHLVKDEGLDETIRNMYKTLAMIKKYDDIIRQLQVAVAKIRMAKYEAHIKAGFTPDQSLELIKDFTQLV